MTHHFDIVIVGAGIAGISLASRIASHRKVLLLEMEYASPYHATARSAALKDPIYVPNSEVAALAMASDAMFKEVPDALRPKAAVHLYPERHLDKFADALARCHAVGARVEALDRHEIARRYPYLHPTDCEAAICAPEGAASTIEVHSLYEHYRRRFEMDRGKILHDHRLTAAQWEGGAWTVRANTDTLVRAPVIVNAAGAWADIVAAKCQVSPLGLLPLKRTVVETSLEPSALAPQPEGPFIFWEGDEDLYVDFKRGGRVLISPADEQISQPCDASAEIYDVALALARFEERTRLNVVQSRGKEWAGLRTFTRDRSPVIGWSTETKGFFWSAAFGGFGIEISLAASAIAADMLLETNTFRSLADAHDIQAEAFSPARLEPARTGR
jgi:D-arginine dehydrogenase